jgi:hypothetical protein
MEVDSPQRPTPKSQTKEYYREYYHTKVKHEYHCPICHSNIKGNFSKLQKHLNTKKCKQLQIHIDSISDPEIGFPIASLSPYLPN